MKILFVVDQYEIGGVCSLVADLCNEGQNNQVSCSVLGGTSPAFSETKHYFSKKVKLNIYPLRTTGNFWLYLQIILRTCQGLTKIIHLDRPDLIVFNTTLSTLGGLLTPATLFIPKISFFHGSWQLEVKSRIDFFGNLNLFQQIINQMKFIVLWVLEFITLYFVRKIIVCSQYSRKLLMKHFGISTKKIFYLPGLVNLNRYRPRTNKITLKSKLKFNSATTLVSLIARPDPRKAIHLLIESAYVLFKQKANFRFIIGLPQLAGPYYAYLLALKDKFKAQLDLPENILFDQYVGFQPMASLHDKITVLQASDIFVMCSTQLETLGLTTLEALSSGTLVAGSKTGATPEILSKLDTRLLINQLNPQTLAKKLSELSCLPLKQKNALRQKGVEIVKRNYQSRVVAASFFTACSNS